MLELHFARIILEFARIVLLECLNVQMLDSSMLDSSTIVLDSSMLDSSMLVRVSSSPPMSQPPPLPCASTLFLYPVIPLAPTPSMCVILRLAQHRLLLFIVPLRNSRSKNAHKKKDSVEGGRDGGVGGSDSGAECGACVHLRQSPLPRRRRLTLSQRLLLERSAHSLSSRGGGGA